MLAGFSMRNFGPFRDDASVSFSADSPDEHCGNILETKLPGQGLLGFILIYGPNCSGKSFFLEGFSVLKKIVSGEDVRRLANPFCSSGERGCCEFSVSASIGFVQIAYSVSFSSSGIASESLYQIVSGHRSMVFSRSGGSFRFGKNSGRDFRSAEPDPFRSFLHSASSGSDMCRAVSDEILSIRIAEPGISGAAGMIKENEELRSVVLRALRLTGFDVTGFDFSGGSPVIVKRCGDNE